MPNNLAIDHNTPEDAEDILSDSFTFLGEAVIDNEAIRYGPLTLTVAPKEGKAISLLADHLFSPALYLAERIERDLLPACRRSVIELGAGSALPSLLLATQRDPPSLVVVTDYPDPGILGNLKHNIETNKSHFQCHVECVGYEWGTDVKSLLKLLPPGSNKPPGYDIVILSDLLHFNNSHDVLITSMKRLLAKSKNSRVHVSAGRYTSPDVCNNFLVKSKESGFLFKEIIPSDEEMGWAGKMRVSGLGIEALTVRKAACRYWIGCYME